MSIEIIAIGRVEKELLSILQAGISKAFHRPVICGTAMPEPVYAFDKRRKQYVATAILRALQEQDASCSSDRILGVVDQDLYVPEFNFVFGQASGTVALVSLMRLRQEFYSLMGVRGVMNTITVTPTLTPTDVKTKIEEAFRRTAAFDAQHIMVETEGRKVILLSGHVHSWWEREEADAAAWAAPGVYEVENRLVVTP